MKNAKDRIISILALLVTILYPCLFMYFQNVAEGNFREIFPAVGKFLLVAGVVFILALVIVRRFSKAALYTILSMIAIMNFNTLLTALRKIIPKMRTIYLLIILAILFAVLLRVFIKKVADGMIALKIIGLVFTILIVIHFVSAIPAITNRYFSENVVENDDSITDFKFEEAKPNVYYFIYDEYGGYENLERYYDYDNEDFYDTLKNAGMNVSYSSRNTESIFTSTIVPNLMNLSYVASDDGYSIDNIALTENASLLKLFQNNGYTVNMIDHLGFLKTAGCNVLNDDLEGDNISTYLINNSALKQIESVMKELYRRSHGDSTSYESYTRGILELMEKSPEYIKKNQPTLTIGYIQSPHDPIMFREDGSILPESQWHNWNDKQLYIGQLKYISQNIENVIENIKKSDPDALVIIQSDHGSRYPYWMVEDYDAEAYDEQEENFYMQNILNCVYYKGETIDIEGESGINTLRKTLNYVFGTSYEMLDSQKCVKTYL